MTGRHATARRDGIHAMPRHARASALLRLVTPPVGPARAVEADEPPVPARFPRASPLPPPEGPVLAVADGECLVVADNPPSGMRHDEMLKA